MFTVKFKNRKVMTKAFRNGFDSYDVARAKVKQLLRANGFDADRGFQTAGYSIVRTVTA
jgi:hypothetical protein